VWPSSALPGSSVAPQRPRWAAPCFDTAPTNDSARTRPLREGLKPFPISLGFAISSLFGPRESLMRRGGGGGIHREGGNSNFW
jgi:hypothetical protein